MASSKEPNLVEQTRLNELKVESLRLDNDKQLIEEQLKAITAGSLKESEMRLELNRKESQELEKQLQIHMMLEAIENRAGKRSPADLKNSEKKTDDLKKQLTQSRLNGTAQESRNKLLIKEEQHNARIRTNVLGIVKAEERRGVKLSEIKKVIETTPSEDLRATAYAKMEEFATGMATKIFSAAISFDKLASSVNAATNTSGQYNDAITGASYSLGRYGVDAAAAGEAVISLRQNFSGMSGMSKEAGDQLVGFTAKMAKAGISADTTAKFIDLSSRTMGLGVKQAMAYEKELFAFSKANGISMKSIEQGLAQVMPRLAAFGKDGQKIYKDLALQAKNMGIEVDKLLNITEQFTTFEGAAEAAGELNSMLGGNVIDSMQLLAAASRNPAEAMELLRDAFASTNKSVTDFSGPELRAFADAAKTDVETLTRVMTMNSAEAQKAALSEKQFNDAVAGFAPIGVKIAGIFQKLAPAIELVASAIGFVVDLIAQIAENDIMGVLIAGIGGSLALVGVAILAIAGSTLFLGQVLGAVSMIATAWTAVMTFFGFATAGAGTAVASTGVAAATAGGAIAAGGAAAATGGAGFLAAGTEAAAGAAIGSTGLTGFTATITALLPFLAAAVPVLLALALAAFSIGLAFTMILLGVTGVVLAIAYLFKILIDGGTASLTAAIAFTILAGSLYVLASALGTLGTLGSIGLAVLGALAAIMLVFGTSFLLVGLGMEKAKEGFDAIVSFDISKLSLIKAGINEIAIEMQKVADSANSFITAMTSPLLMPIVAMAAAAKVTSLSSDALTKDIAATKISANSGVIQANITLEVPVSIDGKLIDTRIIKKVMQMAYNGGDSMASPEPSQTDSLNA